MAKIIHTIAASFWLIATGFLLFFAYSITQTEPNPQALWGWLVMCALTFVSATVLAYNFIFGGARNTPQRTED